MTKTARVSLLLVVLLSVATAVMAQTAASAQSEYPPARASLAFSDTNTEPGQSIEVSGTDFQPGSRVAIVLGNVILRTVTVDSLGNFRTSVTIPCSIPAGPARIEARGTGVDGQPRTVSGSIIVAEGGCPAAGDDVGNGGGRVGNGGGGVGDGGGDAGDGGGRVAATGASSTVPLTLAGVGLVLAGTFAAVVARRRPVDRVGATAR